jgi:uncharacterized repeat protein (TIGR03803 family)
MRLSQTNDGTQCRLQISPRWRRLGWTKQTAATIGCALTLAVLCAVLLIAFPRAEAQTGTTLYNFTGGSDGDYPASSLISDGAGNFYGTTALGGQSCPSNARGCGTVFEISPNGNGDWKKTVLHTFTGPPDGAVPYLDPVIFNKAGNLFGATSDGGAFNHGAVFELSPMGGSWTETVLYSFTAHGDGAHPLAGLIMDQAGNLYGTTAGDPNPGCVFELSPSGAAWTEQVIYGVTPTGGLTMDAAGNMYGTTFSTVFELSPNGNGGWNPTLLHTFTGYPRDGMDAQGNLVFDQAGNLYGITYSGGAKNNGTVYKLSPEHDGQWTEEILYSFKSGKDGRQPWAGVVLDAGGDIYGTTVRGGAIGPKHQGTVFELLAPGGGAGSYKEKVLWSFSGPNGANPYGIPVLDSAGNLYGTAAVGGTNNAGVVFEVTPPVVTTTTLTASPNPSTYGQAVTFSAVVTPAPPDGETVSFVKGKTVLGMESLSGGSASFVTSALPPGGTTVTAVYGGDLKFSGSTSNTVRQRVKIATE